MCKLSMKISVRHIDDLPAKDLQEFQDFRNFQDRGYRVSFQQLLLKLSCNEDSNAVAGGAGQEDASMKREREREREEGESRRIVFVIKLTRMGLINLRESIKQAL